MVMAVLILAAGGITATESSAQFVLQHLLHLSVGDRISFRGTGVGCLVNESSGVISVVCGEPSGVKPAVGSYTVALSDGGADVVGISATGRRLIKLVKQPPLAGRTWLSPNRRVPVFRVVPAGTEFVVGDTHVACQAFISKTAGVPEFACVLTTSLSAGPANGTYGMSVGRRSVTLYRYTNYPQATSVITCTDGSPCA